MTENRMVDPLLRALSGSEDFGKLTEPSWFALLARARENGLLTRLEILVVQHGVLDVIPEKARLQLTDARYSIALNQTEIRFEVDRVSRVLAELDIPIILLKGAAYLLAQLPPARARYAADIDIMVERQHIATVEHALLAAGWRTAWGARKASHMEPLALAKMAGNTAEVLERYYTHLRGSESMPVTMGTV